MLGPTTGHYIPNTIATETISEADTELKKTGEEYKIGQQENDK